LFISPVPFVYIFSSLPIPQGRFMSAKPRMPSAPMYSLDSPTIVDDTLDPTFGVFGYKAHPIRDPSCEVGFFSIITSFFRLFNSSIFVFCFMQVQRAYRQGGLRLLSAHSKTSDARSEGNPEVSMMMINEEVIRLLHPMQLSLFLAYCVFCRRRSSCL